MNSHRRSLVTVATFDEKTDALSLKSWLERKDIPAAIQDETRLQKYWFFVAPRAGIHVQIADDSQARVNRLLHRREAAPLLSHAVLCPSCGSSRVQYPDLTRKNILPTLFGQLIVLLHVARHNYYCEDCHFTWRSSPAQNA